jgi:hypothetical protein
MRDCFSGLADATTAAANPVDTGTTGLPLAVGSFITPPTSPISRSGPAAGGKSPHLELEEEEATTSEKKREAAKRASKRSAEAPPVQGGGEAGEGGGAGVRASGVSRERQASEWAK